VMKGSDVAVRSFGSGPTKMCIGRTDGEISLLVRNSRLHRALKMHTSPRTTQLRHSETWQESPDRLIIPVGASPFAHLVGLAR
jgi:hypothetical protein